MASVLAAGSLPGARPDRPRYPKTEKSAERERPQEEDVPVGEPQLERLGRRLRTHVPPSPPAAGEEGGS